MAVFSGRRDPEWKVPSSDPSYQKICDLLAGARTYKPEEMPARLGFKGFLVRDGQNQRLIVGRETKQLQQKLLDTMPTGLLREGNLKEVKDAIALGSVSAKSVRSSTSASFNPIKWFSDARVRRCNNCYNYANAVRTNTYSQPGQATAQKFSRFSGSEVRDAAVRDGLAVVKPPPAALDQEKHLVALFIDPGIWCFFTVDINCTSCLKML